MRSPIILMAAAVLLISCGGGDSGTTGPPPPSDVVVIRMVGTSFEPANVTIAPGTRVRWVNEGGVHTVTPQNTGQPGVWSRVQTSAAGTVLEHTFSSPSQTYRYRCEPHSGDFQTGMVGVINVTG